MRKFSSLVIATAFVITASAVLYAADPPAAPKPTPLPVAEVKHNGPVDFEKEILPVLRKNCLSCHNTRKAESELILETPQSILKGGVEGPAVVPGKSGESLLFKAASHAKNPIMPPANNEAKAKPLSPEELGLVKLWIDEGAKGEVKAVAAVKWQPLPAGVNPIYSVALSADGRIAAAGRANQIFLYHVPTKRELGRLTDPALAKASPSGQPGVAHLDLVQSLAFNPTGDLLASGGFREVKFWRRPQNVQVGDFAGLEGRVRSVVISANGKLAAFGEESGKIKLYALPDTKSPKTLTGHTAAVTGLAFSADGAKLFSGSVDKSVRSWNTADGATEAQFDSGAEVAALALVNKGRQLATAGGDNTIKVWNLPVAGAEKPPEPKKLAGHNQPVTSLATLGEVQLISGSAENAARIWDVTSGQGVKQLDHGAAITAVAVRADGKRAVTCGANGVAKLWNLESNQAVAELKGDFRNDWKAAEQGRADGMAKRYLTNAQNDLKSAQERLKKEEEEGKKSTEAKGKTEGEFKAKDEAAKKPLADKDEADKQLVPAKDALAKAEETLKAAADDNAKKTAQEAVQKAKQAFEQADQKVKQVAGPAQKALDEKQAAERAMQAAARSAERSAENIKNSQAAIPNLQAAVTQCEQAGKQAQEAAEGAKKAAGPESQKPWKSAAFSADGALVALGGDAQTVGVWSAENGAAVDVFSGQNAVIELVAFADNNVISIAAPGAAKAAVLFDTNPAWKLERTIGSAETPDQLVDRVTALGFSPDGKLLATGGGEPSRSGELKIWDATSGSLVLAVKDPHSDTIFGLEFSPSGDRIATCGADRFMKVFQTVDGKLVKSYEGHTHHVLGVSWQADGRVLATSGADKVVKVWDAQTGDQQRTVQGFNKEVTALVFIKDPAKLERFLAVGADKQIKVVRANDGGSDRSYSGAADFTYAIRASADGGTIVAGGADSALRVWRGGDNDNNLFATFEAPKPAEAPMPAASK